MTKLTLEQKTAAVIEAIDWALYTIGQNELYQKLERQGYTLDNKYEWHAGLDMNIPIGYSIKHADKEVTFNEGMVAKTIEVVNMEFEYSTDYYMNILKSIFKANS